MATGTDSIDYYDVMLRLIPSPYCNLTLVLIQVSAVDGADRVESLGQKSKPEAHLFRNQHTPINDE